jgi:hypothetical protein
MGDNFRPQDGAYVRVDLIFRGRRYMAGEPFDVEGIPDDKLRELHNAKRIAFGRPPQSMIDRASRRIEQLEGSSPQSENEAKAELGVGLPAGPAPSVQAKLKAKSDEQRAERDAKRDKRVSSVKGATSRKGPVKTDVRALRAAQGREPTTDGEDPSYVPPAKSAPDPKAETKPETKPTGVTAAATTPAAPAKADKAAPAAAPR